jgi:hypothetical protein
MPSHSGLPEPVTSMYMVFGVAIVYCACDNKAIVEASVASVKRQVVWPIAPFSYAWLFITAQENTWGVPKREERRPGGRAADF